MSDCAVLSANGEVRYHESATSATSNDDDLQSINLNPPSTPSLSHPSAEHGHPSTELAAPPSSAAASIAPTEHNDTAGSNDDYSVSSEVPLRRSKRGKGRGASNTPGQTNNGVCSDDRVPSCIVEGVEYRTGDFVYYEEPDFEYFTIGLIEEIKFSRRDKFSVLVKCFYRTHDIPETSKQSVLEREHFHTPSNSKLMNDVLSRELFASEVQETLTSKQLRGVCKVSHLSDLRTAMTTFCPTEEDNFFYVFAYNPETRRLMNTRAEIRVGNAYQASIPPFRHFPPATYRARSHRRSHCPKHSRSTGSTSARKHNPSSDAPISYTATADPCAPISDGGDGSMDQPPAPEDLLPALPHKMAEEHTAVDALTINTSPVKMDETEESKSPPKLESFHAGSPKPSPSTSATIRLEHSATDGYHQLSRRHRLLLLRRRGCPNLIDPLRRPRGRRRRRRRRRRWETIVWKPRGLTKALSGQSPDPALTHTTGELADEPLKTYLDAVRSMVAFFGFGGADDDLSSAENGLVLANLAATTQHAYDTLHQSDYSLSQALQAISYNPIVSKNTPRHWTADQVRLFAHALRLHGKDFHTIQREFFGGRSSTGGTGPGSTHASQTAGSSSAGRTRGRGGRRKATGGASSGTAIKGTVKEEDELKSEDGKEEVCGSADDASRAVTHDSNNVGHSEPVKTVKELIAFYYYWKRKGAAASSSSGTVSSVVGPTGTGAGGVSSSLSLQSTGGALASAAVNFSAAVAAAASADSHLATGSSCAQGSAISSQSFGSVGKKRKQTTRGNLSARASTPTSERSESVGASLPDSEVEDTADSTVALGAPEETQPMEGNNDPDDDGTVSAKTSSDAPDVPPSGRLRRRLCRNCEKDLSSPGEAALPAGVGQLRFLCLGCRVHLQKYGELKATNPDQLSSGMQPQTQQKNSTTDGSGPESDIQKSRRSLNRRRRHRSKDEASADSNTTVYRAPSDSRGSSPAMDSHSLPRWRQDSNHRPMEPQSLTHQPFLSPASWSPCSYMEANKDVVSHASSPHSSVSWRSYSTDSGSISGSGCASPSGSSLSAASLSSGCVCSGSLSDSSTEAEPAPLQLGNSRKHHRRTTSVTVVVGGSGGSRSKRRRFQSHTESAVDGRLAKPVLSSAASTTDHKVLMNPKPSDHTATEWPHPLSDAYHCKPVVRDCASVPAVVRSEEFSGMPNLSRTALPPRPGSTPAYKGHTARSTTATETAQKSDIFTSTVERPIPRIPGTHVPWPVYEQDAESDVENEAENDPDLMAILAAPPRDPVPCFVEVHKSNWSNLARTWDRSTQIVLSDPIQRVLHDPGTCARTDLVYLGRRQAAEDKDQWKWERQQLYARHADTAVGPGSVGLNMATISGDHVPVAAQSLPHSLHNDIPGATSDSTTAHANGSNQSTVAYEPVVSAASGYHYHQSGTSSNHNNNNNNNNMALDLCARPAPSHSPTNNVSGSVGGSRVASHSVHNLTTTGTSGNRSHRGSFSGVRHTPSHSPSPRIAAGMQPVSTFDPSHTQHHIQAAYEQAMLLAAAASHYHQHPQQHQQQIGNQQVTTAPMRDMLKPTTTTYSGSRSVPSTAVNTTSAKAVVHSMPSRLGAAAGTFYPPALVTSAAAAAAVGFPVSSVDYRVSASQPFGAVQSVSSAMGIPPMYQHVPHSSTFPSSTVMGYPSGTQSSGVPSSPSSSSDMAFKSPELLQRQLALMGFLSPEHALLNALDPREADALRRFMTEKLTHFRGSVPTTYATLSPHEQQQLLLQHQQQQQQQQELLAAAAAAELVMRRGDHVNMAAHHYQNPANFPLLPMNCGAMTSAVNTITTRPTASVQMPHSFRYPTGTQTPPVSYAAPQRLLDGAALHHPHPHHHQQQSAHTNPPMAHHNSGPRLATTAGTTPFSSAANYLSLLAGSAGNSRGSIPGVASPGPVSNRSNGSSNTNQGANSSGLAGMNGAATATTQQLQEQMMNAAKFAMLAANMQGDPNKALTVANLAAVAFAEIAAAHEKSQTQPPPITFSSHGQSNSARGTPAGSTPQPTTPFDFRNYPTTLLQPHLSDNLATAVAAAAAAASANANPPNFPSPSYSDRRRSVPSNAGAMSSSSSGSLMTPASIPSGSMPTTTNHRLSSSASPLNSGPTGPRLPIPGGPVNRFGGLPPPNVPSPSQLTQFAQLAQQSAAAGFAQGFSLQDPAMLNALMLAAAAAHAANPNTVDPSNPFFGRENEFAERQRLQQLAMGHRPSGPTSHLQQQQVAAAAAAFASAGLPPLNLGARLPSSHS